MKRFTTLIVFLLLCVIGVFAQAPAKFSYQAVVRNATNQLVTNANVGVRISVLQGTATGMPVYVETQTVSTNANGLMTLEIGAGNASQGDFASIDWGYGPYYLKSEVDPNGGSNYSVTSVQQMLSVPYALYAAQAGNVPAFAITPTDTGYVLVLTPAGGTPQTFVLRNGVDGAQGPAGATGPEGPQGPAGATGPEGPQGPVGPEGPQGPAGATGPEGPAGPEGPTGPAGPAGVGIVSITGPLTNGLEDTYTIHYTDGTTSTFVVTNGASGEGAAQTLTLIGDQLSISGGNTVTLPSGGGAPGRGIVSITGPLSNGLEDTYTIHYTDGTTSNYVVTNGAAGATGAQGPQGPVGATGPEGPQGPAGATGPEGPAGPEGPTGPAGPAGVGIVSITGPLTNGLEDTYTIHYTDGTTSTFVVTNGVAGEGATQTLTLIGDQLSISGGNTVTLPSGGGAPGRGIVSITGPLSNGLEDTYTIHYTDGTTSTYVVTNGAAGAAGAQGPQGPAGATGPEGPQGLTGATGPQGPVGPEGPQGPAGATGPAGPAGPEGPQGLTGATGPQGPAGPEGPQGPIGATGPQGPTGATGATGPQGPAGVGIQSITGPVTSGLNDTYTIHYTDGTTSTFVVTNGAAGEGSVQTLLLNGDQLSISGGNTITLPLGSGAPGRGIQSITGPVTSGLEDTYTIHYTDGSTSTYVVTNGAAGAAGPAGATGPQGPAGPEGPQGPIGATGPQGLTGPEGPQGPQGLTGATGPQGPQGPTGATGAQGPAGPTGPEGPAGVGIQSITGPVTSGLENTYTIHLTDGTTTTFVVTNGAAGAQGPAGATGATGATGPQGPVGPAGPEGPQGLTGATGPQGPAGATGAQGPQGPTGATGPQGPEGPAGVGIQSITGPVTSGLENTYTIHLTDGTTTTFVVTNGAAGAQGPAGATGATGATGPQGPTGATGPQGPEGPAGFSPTVSAAASGSNVIITVVDGDGTHQYTIPTPTPEFNQVNSDWNATSGVAEILNKPTVYNASQIQAMIDQTVGSLSAQLAQQQDQIANLQNALANQSNDDAAFACGTSQVYDVDGNAYNTVKIGQQCWMKENLRVTHTPGGSAISYLVPSRPDNSWEPRFGYLYVWDVAMNGQVSSTSNPSGVQGICPSGWHVPSNSEFTQLTNYVGSVGDYLCSGNTSRIAKALAANTDWATSSVNCAVGNDLASNNATGLSILPATNYGPGYNQSATLWLSTQYSSSAGETFGLLYDAAVLNVPNYAKYSPLAVRCVRDVPDGLVGQMQEIIDSMQNAMGIRPSVTITNTHAGDLINFPYVTAQVTPNDGELVFAKGFCWSTSENPTIQNNNYVIVDTASNTFKASLTKLTSTTATYYIRAFASNVSGTSYSDQVMVQRGNYYAVPRSGHRTITLNVGQEIWVYDIGGPDGNYAENGLNGYLTIESNNLNYKVMMVSGSYATESATSDYDYLDVYEGVVTNATTGYLKRFRGNGNVIPLAPSASNSDLTLRFRSDNSQANYGGFAVKLVLVDRPCAGSATVSDYDGNTYHTVEIGEQCWMKENMRTTHYANGNSIDYGGNSSSTTTRYYYYPNGSSSNGSTYGKLYNWSAACNNTSTGTATTAASKVQGICPSGWHVPAKEEFATLKNYIQSNSYYGADAKALSSTTGWNSSTSADTPGNSPETNNSTGFSAMPAGYCLSGSYNIFGQEATFWTSTWSNNEQYNDAYINYDAANFGAGTATRYRAQGVSVRCIKN